MERVDPEKLQAKVEAALKEMRSGAEAMVREFIAQSGLRADQIELVQEVTPSGIKIFVQQRKPKEEGETRDHDSERRS